MKEQYRTKNSRATFYGDNFGWNIQNLNDRGSILRHGRINIFLRKKRIYWEWLALAPFCHLRLIWGAHGEPAVGLSVGVPLVGAFWLRFENFVPERWMSGPMVASSLSPGKQYKMIKERQIGIDVIDKTIGLSLWHDPDEWSSGDPWWWRIRFDPVRLLLGRTRYSEQVLETVNDQLVLPEGAYPVEVVIFKSTWQRPRWRSKKQMRRATINADPPIRVHAGHGDNDWDQDDELLYEMTLAGEVTSAADAIAIARAKILNDRKRYGNPRLQEA